MARIRREFIRELLHAIWQFTVQQIQRMTFHWLNIMQNKEL